MELWGFKVDGVWLSPSIQRPLAAKLCVRPQKVFEMQERARGPLSPCQVWWGSDFTRCRDVPLPGRTCLFVTLLNVRVCAPDFAIKALEYRNDFFDTVG